MKGKKLIVIMAIIVLMFTIQASTALDIDDNVNLTQTIDTDVDNIDLNNNIQLSDEIISQENLSDVVSVSSHKEDVLGVNNAEKEVLGRNIHVAGSTLNDYFSAIRSAGEGDNVFLDGLTFTGPCNVNGWNSNNYKIYGGSSVDDPTRATVDLSGYTGTNLFWWSKSPDVFISGINFVNFTKTGKNEAFEIFTATYPAKSIVIQNCTFSNFNLDRGPGSETILIRLTVQRGSTTKVTNCDFFNNNVGNVLTIKTANNYGTASIIGINNTFINNTANIDYDKSANGLGLCYKLWGSMTNNYFEGNTFINNTGAVHGAAYCILGKYTTIVNDYIEGNGAVYGSGIEAHSGGVKVYNSTFNNNFAVGTHSYAFERSGSGAAIAFVGPDNYVENCTFIDNYAECYAGAVDIIGANTVIVDSRFFNNTAGKYAGAVHIQGENTVIRNDTLVNNNATIGGGIYLEGDHSRISLSNFTDNNAIQGAACYIEGYDAFIETSRFIDNNATHDLGSKVPDNSSILTAGGAVFLKGNHSTIIYNIFEDNSAEGNYRNLDGFGGAVYIEGGNPNFHNDNFINNYATLGGAVYIKGDNIASKDLNFTQNRAIAGGAVYIKGNNVTINASDYKSNIAIQGGALHIDGNDVKVINSNINDNNATRAVGLDMTGSDHLRTMGGAIHIDGSNVEVHDNNLTKNTAIASYADGGFGGAVSIIGDNTIIYDNNIVLNDAVRGGAIYVHGVNTTIKNMDFTTNLAIYGGAIYVEGIRANITNNTFYDNNATHNLTYKLNDELMKLPTNGGAIYIEGNESSITNNNFTYNAAIGININGGHGGAIYIQGYLTNITHNEFIDNEGIMGGALYIVGTNTTIDDTNFTNDNAIRGGAIYVEGVNATLTNLNFEFNNATHILTYPLTEELNKLPAIGGAISIEGNNTLLENINFSNNTAYGVKKNGGLGGAIAVNGYDTTIRNVEFVDNQAIIGGALYINGTLNTLNYTNFTNNAAIRGGAVFNYASNTTIIGSTYKNNSATHDLRFKVSDELQDLTAVGGAVAIQGATINVTECEFYNNTAVGIYLNGGLGGAIAVNGSNNHISNSIFKDNEAIKGGAFYLEGNTTHIIDSNFSDNNALKGGAGYIEGKNSVIESSYFDDNDARHDLRFGLTDELKSVPTAGGAIYIVGDNVNVTSSNFTDNDAKAVDEKSSIGGGVFYIEGNNANISKSYFENNTALKGGAVFITGNDTKVYDSNFTKNSVTNFTVMEGLGGAVYLENSHGSDFTRCNFTQNSASINGGAIDWHEGATDGQIVECIFENNTAGANAGAVFWFGQGGIIQGSNFTNNKANGTAACMLGNCGDGGAIMWTGSDGTVDDCNFINNAAKDHGGAVFLRGVEGRADCDNNTFKNSHFENNTAGTNGGAVDWHQGATNGTIENSTFNNNVANRSGGAVFWNGNTGTITSSNFTNNRVTGTNKTAEGKGGDGGAINWIGSDGLIDNCNFINNTAPRTGGAVYLDSLDYLGHCDNTTFSNSHFENNSAGMDAGAIMWNEGATNGAIINSTFVNNSAKSNAGAVLWWGDNGNIEGSNFTNNRALGEVKDFKDKAGDAGAVLWSGSNGLVDGCRFINNTATSNGGAVYLTNVTNNLCNNTAFRNSHFENNSAGVNGGSIDWHEGATNGAIENSSFVNNSAKANGGAVFWFGTNGTIKGSNFTDNKALGQAQGTYGRSGDGGAVIWTGSNGLVDDCRFINNSAQNKGGAVYLDDLVEGGCDNTTFVNSYFENNTANITGGAIMWNAGATNGTIENSTFVNNTAHRAGGAVFWNGEKGTIKSSNFTHNRATGLNLTEEGKGGDGGAIVWIGSDGLVDDCNFDNNTAANTGGAVYLETSEKWGKCDNTTFSNSHFNNNAAGTNGGAILWNENATNGKIINSTFDNNTANRSAGAVYWYGTNGTIDNSNFTNNHALGLVDSDSRASGVGGAVMWIGSNGLVNNTKFTNNTADKDGGAVYIKGTANDCDNTTFENSYFENNYAKINGGAVNWNEGATNGNIINSTFVNNLAEANAGAVYWFGTNGTIKDSNFTNNKANGTRTGHFGYSGDGGAVMWTGSNGLVENTTFVNNTATNDGGAVYLRKLADGACENTTFSKSKFINNTAANEGGAIDWNEGAIKGTIENSTFINNSATDGGAVSWTGHYGLIVDSNFTNNSASENGGAVRWSGIHGQIDNSIFEDNNATYGGAVYLRNCAHGEDTNMTISDSYFKNNTASQDGGAINWHLGTNATVDSSEFVNNTAKRGGAAFINGTDGKIKGSNFTSNEAVLGGAVYVNNESINVTDSNFTKNAAVQGGAVYVDAENTRIADSEFTNNTATYDVRVAPECDLKTKGGAIYINSENTVIENSKFINNTALTNREYNGKGNDLQSSDDGFGGAIYVGENKANITSSEFNDNKACNGSAIYNDASNTLLNNDTFIKNQAWSYILNSTVVPNSTYYGSTVTISALNYTGGDNIINGIYNAKGVNDIVFKEVNYIVNNDESQIRKANGSPVLGTKNSSGGNLLYQDSLERYQVIVVEFISKETGNVVATKTVNTDLYGNHSFDISDLPVGNYTVKAYHPEDRNYKYIETLSELEIKPYVDLNITKTVNSYYIVNGDVVTFTITVSNPSNASVATNVKVKDIPPANGEGFTLISGADSFDAETGIWEIGEIANGTNVTLTLSFRTSINGIYNNTVKVNCSEAEWNYSNNNDTVFFEVIPFNLSIDKQANLTVVANNTFVNFTIAVTNNAVINATNLVLTDTLPSGFVYISSTYGGTNSTLRNVKWEITNLTEGKTIYINVIAKSVQTGKWTNNVTVYCAENRTAVKANETVDVVPVNLTVNKTANITVVANNTLVKFTIIVNNTSKVNATDVIVRDELPDGFTFVSASEGCDFVGDAYQWNIEKLEKTAELWIIVRTNSVGNLTNNVTVTSHENRTVVKVNETVEVVAVILTVNKTANATKVANNTLVNFTITVNNTSVVNATGINVKDILPDGFVFVSASKGYSNKGQTVSWVLTNITAGNQTKFWIVARSNATGPWMNKVNVTCSENSTIVTDNVTVNVVPVEVKINKTANLTSVGNNTLVNFTITVNNTGVVNVSDVIVHDLLPNGFVFVSASGDYSINGREITWKFTNVSAGNVTELWIVARSNATGPWMNKANVKCKENSTYNKANVTVNVIPINITVNKTVNVTLVGNNTLINFTITVNNTSVVNATEVIVRDALPAGLTFVDASGDCKQVDGAYQWNITKLENVAKLWIVARTNSIGDWTNWVNVTSKENSTIKRANKTVNVRGVNLTINKTTLVSGNISVDEDVTFKINVTNNAEVNATQVTVTDIAPRGFTFVESNDTAYDNKTGILTVNVLKPGESYIFTVTLKAITNGTLTNYVNVTSNENDTLIKSNASVNVTPVVKLTVIKTAEFEDYIVGDIVVFTINITNNGPSNATNIKVRDLLPEGLDLTEGNLESNIGFLKAGDSVKIVIKARVSSLIRSLTNKVNVTCDQNDTIVSANVTVHVYNIDLRINKTANKTTVPVNGLINFTITVKNHSPYDATNVNITDSVNKVFTIIDTNGTNTTKGNDIIWNVGTLHPDDVYTIWLVVKANTNGTFTNTAYANCSEERELQHHTEQVTVTPVVRLDIDKSSAFEGKNVTAGQLVQFTIDVVNNGISNATGVVITDVVPYGFEFNSTNATGYNNKTGKLTVDLIKPGEHYIFTVTLKVMAEGKLTNVVNATCKQNSTIVKDQVSINGLPVIITVNKTVDLKVVGNNTLVNFTITVNNTGVTNATNVTVVDELPDGFKFVNATAGYTNSSQIVKWTIDKLNNNTVVKYWITAISYKVGPWTNYVNVSCSENKTVVQGNVSGKVVPIKLTIDKIANLTAVGNNTLVNFTITVNNTGEMNATNVTIRDILPNGFKFVNATAGYDNSSRMVNWTIAKLNIGAVTKFWIVALSNATGLWTNTANITCSENNTNVSSSVNVDVRAVNITVVKDANLTVVGNNTLVNFTITVENVGVMNATDVTVRDELPNGFVIVNAAAGNTTRGNVVSWTIDKLDVEGIVKFWIVARTISVDNLTNWAYVKSNENKTENSTNKTVYVKPVEIAVVKDANITKVGNNTLVNFTITVENVGEINATNVAVRDELPNGLTFVNASAGYTNSSQTVNWTIAKLNVEGIVKFWIVARTVALGDLTNWVYVKSYENSTEQKANKTINVVQINGTVVKKANLNVVGNNSLVNFTIVVIHTSLVNATNVTVSDILPNGFVFDNASGVYNRTGQKVEWHFAVLLPGQVEKFWITARSNKTGGYDNTVNVTCKENSTLLQSTTHVDVVDVKLTVNKTVDIPLTANNTIVNFTITVNNTAGVNATNVIIKDLLPQGLTFVNASEGYNRTDGKWTIKNIKNNSAIKLWITARTNAIGNLTNNVTVECDENSTVVEDYSTVDVRPIELEVIKKANLTVIANNTLVNFTITVKNKAGVNATNVTVRDVVPVGFTIVKTSSGNVTDGQMITWKLDKLLAGNTTELWIVALSKVIGSWNNTAKVNCSENKTVVNSSAAGNVKPVNITVVKDANLTVVGNNTLVNFTITVENVGVMNTTDVTVRDELPNGFVVVNATAGNTTRGNVVSWTIDKLDVEGIVKFWIVARTASVDNLTNWAYVKSNENKTESSANKTVYVKPVNITVVKEANLTKVGNNTLVNFTITVENVGVMNATDVTVRDVLPYGFAAVNASAGNTTDGQEVKWTISKLNVGDVVKFWIVARTASVDNLTNWVYVKSNENKTESSTNKTVNVKPVNITVVKDVNITKVGNNTLVNFTITVENIGEINATNVTVRDELPNGLTFVNASAGYSNSTQTVNWTISKLNVKDIVSFWIVARTASVGDLTNWIYVKSDENRTETKANKTVNVLQTNGTVVKKANMTLIGNNTLVNFTIVVNHTSLVNATNVTVSDILPNGFVFDNASGNYNRTGQKVEWYFAVLLPGQVENLWISARSNQTGIYDNTVNVTCKENSTMLQSKTTVEVASVNATITKKANLTLIGNDTLVNFTITVNNTSRINATNVIIKDTLPEGLVFVNATKGYNRTDNEISWYVGDLVKNHVVTYWIVAKSVAIGNWTNYVNATCNENTTIIGANESVNVVPVNFTVIKTSDRNSYMLYELITYTIKVTNTARVNATNVTVVDIIDLTKFDVESSNMAYVQGGNKFTWTIDSINAGDDVTIEIVVKSKTNGTFINNVDVTAKENKTSVTNNTTVYVAPIVNLIVEKTVNINKTGLNNEIYFMFTVTNKGPSVATNVVVRDVLDEGFEFMDSNMDYNNETGEIIIPKISPGKSEEFYILVQVTKLGKLNNTVYVKCRENQTEISANASVDVVPIELKVTKTANVSYVGNGSLVNFTIVVNNTNDIVASDLIVVDVLLEGFEYVDSTRGGLIVDNVLTWYGGSIENNTSRVYWVVVKAVSINNWTNEVEVKYLENDTMAKSNTTVHVVPVNLTINKTANADVILVGSDVTFTVNITNNARANATGVKVRDIVPEGFEFVKSNDTGYDNKTGLLTVPIIEAGKSYVFAITLKALTNGTLTNVANVTCNENSTVKNSTVKVSAVHVVNLTVVKVADSDDATIGDIITYTITVTNNGPSNATQIRVVDVLDSGLTLVSGELDQIIPFLASGNSTQITVKVRTTASGNYMNRVNVSCAENDTVKSAIAEVHVYKTDLKINKIANESDITVHGLVNFTITVKNHGKSNATNVHIIDELDESFEFVNASGNYTKDGQNIIWNVEKVANETTYSVWIVVKALSSGNIENIAHVNCSEEETVKNTTTTVTVEPIFDLTVNKTVSSDSIKVGDEVIFTINVTNHGPSDAHAVNITDKVPEGFEFVKSNDNNYNNKTGLLTVPFIKAGESYVFTITLKAISNGTLINVVNVTTGDDGNVKNSSVSVNVAPVVELTVITVSDVNVTVIGKLITFTINVTNRGPSAATNIAVEDVLPEGLQVISGDLKTVIAKLESGESYIITITVNATSNGTFTNKVTVNCSENNTDVEANASVKVYDPKLTVKNTANDEFVYSTNQTSFTATVTNTGDVTLTGVYIDENIPSELIYDHFIGPNWTYDGHIFYYNGSLGVGESIELTIVVNTTQSGYFTNIATAGSDNTSESSGKDSVMVYTPDLIVREISNNPLVIVGTPVSFTVVVTNIGDCDLGDIYVVNNFPEGLIYTGYEGSSWSKISSSLKGEVLGVEMTPGWVKDGNKFTYSGILRPGESANYTLFFDTTRVGTFTPEVIAGSNLTRNDTEKAYSNNTTVVIAPKLAVEKVVDAKSVKVGQLITFTVKVTNAGVCYLGDIFVIENAPEGLKYVRHSSGWNKDGNRFTYNGELAPGKSISLDIVFNATEAGNFTNAVIAGSNLTGNVSATADFKVVNKTAHVKPVRPNNTDVPKHSTVKESFKPVEMYATGNPIMLLLLVIIAVIPLKRRKH